MIAAIHRAFPSSASATAGQAIASGLRETGIERIAAWDILFPVADGARLKAAGEAIGVRLAKSAADVVRDTDMIISAVTAASSLEAARSVEPHLSGAPYYLDINSVSPGRKRDTAALLLAARRATWTSRWSRRSTRCATRPRY